MAKMKQTYIVDERGKRKSVVLDIASYRALLERIEDLEDALELDEAVRTETEFRPYEEIRGELRKTGRL